VGLGRRFRLDRTGDLPRCIGIGVLWNAPNMRLALAALEAKEMPAVGAAMKRVPVGRLLMVALLVFAEFAMVFRVGAG